MKKKEETKKKLENKKTIKKFTFILLNLSIIIYKFIKFIIIL